MGAIRVNVEDGIRFEFGENWARFLEALTEERIHAAELGMTTILEMSDLHGKTFVDVGSGSGLSSLVARRLGARVHSFDYDPRSVACTEELRRRYFPGDAHWSVERGSVLDEDYLARLGQFNIVYSWGVLHHTGAMWSALANVERLVAPEGRLFVAIYNDQGRASRRWLQVKWAYNRLPAWGRAPLVGMAFARLWGPTFLRDLVRGNPLRTWHARSAERGMSPWRDAVDWIGGYPFEVASPDAVLDFVRPQGYQLRKLRTCGAGHGCNEFVFEKRDWS